VLVYAVDPKAKSCDFLKGWAGDGNIAAVKSISSVVSISSIPLFNAACCRHRVLKVTVIRTGFRSNIRCIEIYTFKVLAATSGRNITGNISGLYGYANCNDLFSGGYLCVQTLLFLRQLQTASGFCQLKGWVGSRT
jgi:hypothetical protein